MVHQIIIDGDSLLEGKNPNFPYPVLTTISIVDNQGNFITDLADTLLWLSPDDIAQIGLPISEIWNPIVEYHRDNPEKPKNPNLYDQVPYPQFKEIRQDVHIPSSTMLVMDVSTSMSEKLDDVKAGAKLYIEQLRPVDRAGIVLFNHDVMKLQKFTNNKELLIETINAAETDFGTAINDALMAAIQETKFEKSRPRIIVYTDGRDNNSDYTPNAVIDSALVYDIPIYTISLEGGYTVEDTLKQIAGKTGGLFFRADSAKQMKDIYSKLSDLIQHFYVMAHISPDPIRNNTWRTVDVTVNTPDSNGNYITSRGVGNYFIKSSSSELSSDISVDLSSITDTTFVELNDTLNAVFPGEKYVYRIKVSNLGQGKANYVKLTYLLPDSVHFSHATIQPSFIKDSLYVWQFFGFDTDEKVDILVNVQLESKIPTQLSELTSSVELIADNDYNLANNFDEEMVYVLFPPPIIDYDLALVQQVGTDSAVIIDNNSIQVAYPGEIVKYKLKVENLGPATAYNFELWDILPDSIEIINLDGQPFKHVSDTLFWQIDSLAVGEFLSLSFEAVVADSFVRTPFLLINKSWVVGENDVFEENNYAETTVYAISKLNKQPLVNVDISVSQSAKTDSLAIVEDDTLHFARSGETYTYLLTIFNHGLETAQSIRIANFLPDSVKAGNFQPAPEIITDDSVAWYLDDLASLSFKTMKFDITVSQNMPIGKNVLMNKVMAFANNEHPELFANNISMDTVFNFVKPSADLLPLITATPPVVDIGEQVAIAVQVPYPVQSWDIWVHLADGTVDERYADLFIKNTPLEENKWYNIDEKFTNTKLFTSVEQEQILFELRTMDIFGELRTAQTSVTVMSNNNFYLDRNVFEAHKQEPLTVNFKLSTNRMARLELYDISGKKLTNLTEGHYHAGWNKYQWNGVLENGQRIGSGLYLIALKSENYNVLKKVMIVQ